MRPAATPFLRLPSLLLAVMALVVQLAVGALGPVDAAADRQLSELAAAMGQCRTPAPGEPGQDTRHRRLPDCAPAATAAGLVLPGFTVAPQPAVPGPGATVTVRLASRAEARAPPSHESHTGFPRGPPSLG